MGLPPETEGTGRGCQQASSPSCAMVEHVGSLLHPGKALQCFLHSRGLVSPQL